MTIVLTLKIPQDLPEGLRTQRIEFGPAGGLIGRHSDCDWVLDDPQKIVSSRHARIISSDTGYLIEDLSTNGTSVNGAPVGRGKKVELRRGHEIQIGRFAIAVESHEDMVQPFAPDPVAAFNPMSTAQTPLDGPNIDDFLGDEKSAVLEPYAEPIRSNTPGRMEVASPPKAVKTIPDDWWKSPPTNEETPEELAPPVTAPISAPPQPSQPPPPESSDSSAFATAFAAALSPNNNISLDAETGQALGSAVRELLAGSLGLVRARQALRSELRMVLTMIGVQENNPFKHSISIDDLLDRFMNGASRGYLPPSEASLAIMTELQRHEYAVIAGIEAGLEALLAALEPPDLPSNPLTVGKAYKDNVQKYTAIKAAIGERGAPPFWPAFIRAYEQVMAARSEPGGLHG